MILFLHNRYRTSGGEERAVQDLMWLVRERLGEDTELLERDSGAVSRPRAAAGLLRGGLAPRDVARAVRLTRARVVHAHNVHPAFGWRALAAAREAGARVVLHLHQFRLVCAVGVCFTDGAECTRCHGRDTLPGVRHNCRGSRPESLAYGAALALWQRRLVESVDAFVVPSAFALERLQAMGAPVPRAHVVPHVLREFASAAAPGTAGHALIAARLAPEKGIEVAIAACAELGLPLVVAGEGPQREALERRGSGSPAAVTFVGRADDAELARLRSEAVIALAPSRFAETFGLAAAEAMAAGLPVAASRIGALPELVPAPWLSEAGDPAALAAAIIRVREAADPGREAIERARALSHPDTVAPKLRAVYDGLSG